jgi:hypothetical protein
MHKQWNSEQRRAEIAERKWLDTYRPPARVSGRHLYAVPEYVYAGVGGYKELDKHPRPTLDK